METISQLFSWSFCLLNNVYTDIFMNKKSILLLDFTSDVFHFISKEASFRWGLGEEIGVVSIFHHLFCQLFRHSGEGSCLHVNSVSTRPMIPSEIEGLGIVHKVMNLLPGYRRGKGEQNLSSLMPRTLQPLYEQCPQH